MKKGGLDVARNIRAHDPNAIIVFATTYSEMMPTTYRYKVSALDFIDKGIETDAFNAAVDEVICYTYHHVGQAVRDDAFIFKTQQAHIQMPFSDSFYFETSLIAHKVILHTKKGQLEFYGTLSTIVKENANLYRSHRAYVVNPENIIQIDRTKRLVFFEDKRWCFVSKLKLRGLVHRIEKS